VTVESRDGKRCSIIVRCSAKKVYKSTLNQLADEFCVPRGDIEEVLDTWTHEQLAAHLDGLRLTYSIPQRTERPYG
jgi:hypothetical protein